MRNVIFNSTSTAIELSRETSDGYYIMAMCHSGEVKRYVNMKEVKEFPPRSIAAKQVEQAFAKHEHLIESFRKEAAAVLINRATYNAKWWELKEAVEAE